LTNGRMQGRMASDGACSGRREGVRTCIYLPLVVSKQCVTGWEEKGAGVARNDLIEAYQNGRISRRAFVRGMMALGASASVAVSLADGVRAAPGARKANLRSDDTYEDVYELPSTGAGVSGSGDSWVKPLAVLGAGAALVAGGLRRLKGSPNTAE
jgi:hypothetical protein